METIKIMSRPACKAVLSEAFVAGDNVPGMSLLNGCLEGSTSSSVKIQHSTVFQTAALFFVTWDYVPDYDRFA